MSGSFTPGPWSAEADQGGDVEIFSRAPDECTMLIAEVFAQDMGNKLPQMANARLIAAAPDLLALLERIANDYPPSSIGWEWIDAAIAKATGA